MKAECLGTRAVAEGSCQLAAAATRLAGPGSPAQAPDACDGGPLSPSAAD